MRRPVSRILASLPPIAQRERRITSLKQQRDAARDSEQVLRTKLAKSCDQRRKLRAKLDRIESDLEAERALAQRVVTPTFSVMLEHYRSKIRAGLQQSLHPTNPSLQIPFKLRNIALAQSHGIATAEVLRAWPSIDEIDLADLPEQFVLKSDGGAGARGVFPLVRHRGDYRRIDLEQPLTETEIKDRLRALADAARPPYFAEEFLPSAGDAHVPDDVKVYCFYGEAVQVLLNRPVDLRVRRTGHRRYLDPHDASDLGEVLPGFTYSDQVQMPKHFYEIVDAAKHLSRAAGTSFCRVDFYDTPDGPRAGEITRAPGGKQRYRLEHDARLAEAWIDAELRLEADLASGRPAGASWGHHEHDWHYRESTDPTTPGAWHRPRVRCKEWCHF